MPADETVVSLVDDLVAALIDAKDSIGDSWRRDEYDEARRRVLRLIPAAQALAAALPYNIAPESLDPTDLGWEFDSTHDAAVRLQGALLNAVRVREMLSQHAPQLSVESMHPWVWDAAESLWRDGHHRNAIHAAAAQVEARLQAKLGREDVSGVALVREAFTLKLPAEGKARLRFTWLSEGSEAFTSRHEGAMAFGAGVFQLIRNSAAHQPTKLSENVALEHLASLSYLARLIDAASVLGSLAPEPATERPFG